MTDPTPIRAVKPALKTQLIPLNKLIISKLNVRKHGPKDVDTLAASIAAKGLLQPFLVRPSGKSFEVIFGQRRAALDGIPARPIYQATADGAWQGRGVTAAP